MTRRYSNRKTSTRNTRKISTRKISTRKRHARKRSSRKRYTRKRSTRKRPSKAIKMNHRGGADSVTYSIRDVLKSADIPEKYLNLYETALNTAEFTADDFSGYQHAAPLAEDLRIPIAEGGNRMKIVKVFFEPNSISPRKHPLILPGFVRNAAYEE